MFGRVIAIVTLSSCLGCGSFVDGVGSGHADPPAAAEQAGRSDPAGTERAGARRPPSPSQRSWSTAKTITAVPRSPGVVSCRVGNEVRFMSSADCATWASRVRRD